MEVLIVSKRIQVRVNLPGHLHKKLKDESNQTGVSMNALILLSVATRYEGELLPISKVNRDFENARLQDLENEQA